MLGLVPTEHWEYGPTDVLRGFLTALSSPGVGPQTYIHLPGVGPCLPVRSGRAAIVLALKALDLAPGACVAAPLYCCPVVFQAINAAGCRTRFIDVDPHTYCLSATDLATKSSEVDAVIAVHMFGNLCDMPALQEAAQGKPFIEDCAQALCSRLSGRFAGSFGEIAAFSFRSGKYLSAGEGGAIYSSHTDLESRLSELIQGLPVPDRVEESVHVAKTYLRSLLRRKPLWGSIGSRLWSAYTERVGYTRQSPIVLGQVYATDWKTSARRFAALSSWIEKQRSNADYYSRNLTVDADMLCWETHGAFFNRLQYPLRLPTSVQRDQMAARLRTDQISTATPYKDIAAIASTYYGYNGDCPQAESMAKTVLVIPSNYALKASEVERIAMSVNRAWAEVRGRRRDWGVPSTITAAAVPPKSRHGVGMAETHHFS